MGLFVSSFERAMYKELMDSPFLGYSLVAQVPLSDIIFDFCASVSHNKDIFPNGVEKKKRERVLYANLLILSSSFFKIVLPTTHNKPSIWRPENE